MALYTGQPWKCHLFGPHTTAPVCACYVPHTLLYLKHTVNKVSQATGFNVCILVKIPRILKKLLALGLRVCFHFACGVFVLFVFGGVVCLFLCVCEIGSPYIVPGKAQLLGSSHPPASASTAAGVTGTYHYTGLTLRKISIILPESRAKE